MIDPEPTPGAATSASPQVPDRPKDLAYNIYFVAYDTGKPDREKEKVIRINGTIPVLLRAAKETLTMEDDSNAGITWSDEENNLDGAHRKELVVVVGEFLPESIKPGLKVKRRKGAPGFDPEAPVSPTQPQARIVARRLIDNPCQLCVLCKKVDGLCQLAPIPAGSDDRIVFYSEFATDLSQPNTTNCKKVWQASVNEWCRQYRLNNRDTFPGEPLSTALLGEDDTTESPASVLDAAVDKRLQDEEEKSVRGQLREFLFDEQVRHPAEAEKLAIACKRKWFKTLEMAKFSPIDAESLLSLALGLQLDSLKDIQIDERLYRAFIINFSTLWANITVQNDQILDWMIRVSLRMASLVQFESQDPNHALQSIEQQSEGTVPKNEEVKEFVEDWARAKKRKVTAE